MIVKKIDDKERSFEFGTYTFKVIDKMTGVKNVKDVFSRLGNNDMPFLMVIVYACAINACRINKTEVDFNDDDVYDWADKLTMPVVEEMMVELIQAYKIKNQKAPETGRTESQ
jgi:phosphopentomutase